MKHKIKKLIIKTMPSVYKYLTINKIYKKSFESTNNHEIELFLLKDLKLSSGICFDVGANVGHYSTVMEKYFGSKNLYIFEPLPDLASKLSILFKYSNVFNIALSNTSGNKILNIPYINNIAFKTRATLSSSIKEKDLSKVKKINIKTITLDDFMHENKIDNLGLIKIDVEGHEYKVLEGGYKSLLKYKPTIIIEIEQRHHDHDIYEIFSYIENIGYKGYWVDKSAYKINTIKSFSVKKNQNVDFLHSRNFNLYTNNFLFFNNNNSSKNVEIISNVLSQQKVINNS